ncbi:MAG: metalloregulator ArsR/SmtB family transcription factor [Candidatus Micrarchaeota archaeon]
MKERLKLFKALSDETRLNIVEFLLGGEQCVCCIQPHVKRSQSTVSLQLNKLENLGVVKQRREGKYIYYSIADETIRKLLYALGVKRGKKNGRKEKRVC